MIVLIFCKGALFYMPGKQRKIFVCRRFLAKICRAYLFLLLPDSRSGKMLFHN